LLTTYKKFFEVTFIYNRKPSFGSIRRPWDGIRSSILPVQTTVSCTSLSHGRSTQSVPRD